MRHVGRPLGKDKILEYGRGNNGSYSIEKSLWKKLWTCRRTDYGKTVNPSIYGRDNNKMSIFLSLI
jgi:hypothetical protein